MCDIKKNMSKLTFILYLAKLWKVDDTSATLKNKDNNWNTNDWIIQEDYVTNMYYIEKRNDPGGKVLGIDGNIVGEDRIEGEFVEKHKCRI